MYSIPMKTEPRVHTLLSLPFQRLFPGTSLPHFPPPSRSGHFIIDHTLMSFLMTSLLRQLQRILKRSHFTKTETLHIQRTINSKIRSHYATKTSKHSQHKHAKFVTPKTKQLASTLSIGKKETLVVNKNFIENFKNKFTHSLTQTSTPFSSVASPPHTDDSDSHLAQLRKLRDLRTHLTRRSAIARLFPSGRQFAFKVNSRDFGSTISYDMTDPFVPIYPKEIELLQSLDPEIKFTPTNCNCHLSPAFVASHHEQVPHFGPELPYLQSSYILGLVTAFISF